MQFETFLQNICIKKHAYVLLLNDNYLALNGMHTSYSRCSFIEFKQICQSAQLYLFKQNFMFLPRMNKINYIIIDNWGKDVLFYIDVFPYVTSFCFVFLFSHSF